jgi:hypothetical protein
MTVALSPAMSPELRLQLLALCRQGNLKKLAVISPSHEEAGRLFAAQVREVFECALPREKCARVEVFNPESPGNPNPSGQTEDFDAALLLACTDHSRMQDLRRALHLLQVLEIPVLGFATAPTPKKRRLKKTLRIWRLWPKRRPLAETPS